MNAPDLVAVLFVFAKTLLPVVAIVYLVSGIDDVFIDIVHVVRSLYRRFVVLPKCPRFTAADLLARTEQPIAIMIPAWQESAVIQRMLENTLADLQYANYHIFVGTYPNDAATQQEVEIVRERHGNVHRIVCPRNGPTNKADCLNWVYQGIQAYERDCNIRFEIFVMDDAEDVIHPLALKVFNHLIPRKDMVQLPVVPFEPPALHFTAGHYLDEFAENHSKDLVVREALGGGLPSAGVGCGFSRRAVEAIARDRRNLVFSPDSLTEDYEFGLTLQRLGLEQVFVRFRVPQTVKRRSWLTGRDRTIAVKQPIAIREYFPADFRAAVRQKSRWIVGIALQGWANLGWRGSFRLRYMLMRDRKTLITSPLNLVGYAVVAAIAAAWAIDRIAFGGHAYPPIVEAGSWLYPVVVADTGFLFIRLLHRVHAVRRLYGWRQALLSIPRSVWGNVINFAATARALYLYAGHLVSGKRIAWDKTAHAYPSEAELRSFRRPLGDMLLERRLISIAGLQQALARQRATGRPLGALLVEMGLVAETSMLESLSAQLRQQVRHIDPYETTVELLRLVPRQLAVHYTIFPVELDSHGRIVMAAFDCLTDEQRVAIQRHVGHPLAWCLSAHSDITFAIRRGYERLLAAPETRRPRLGDRLVAAGLVTREQLRDALTRQRRQWSRLGDIIVEHGLLSRERLTEAIRHYTTADELGRFGKFLVDFKYLRPEQLDAALATQASRTSPLGHIIVGMGLVSRDTLEQLAAA